MRYWRRDWCRLVDGRHDEEEEEDEERSCGGNRKEFQSAQINTEKVTHQFQLDVKQVTRFGSQYFDHRIYL